jgi:glycosyltransferase EpsE
MIEKIKRPIISVVMAVYNGEKYLDKAIQSILSQSFTDFEFLIVNDSSTDQTVSIIETYADSRIRLHNNEKNLGQINSLNVGLQLSSGQFIARMDADDYAMPTRLEKQLQFIKKYHEYSVVGTDCLVVNESGKKHSISRGQSEWEDVILSLLSKSPINHVSVLINKDHILSVGGYQPSYRISADFDLWSRMVRHGYRITTIHEVLSAYRISGNSLSNVNEKEKLEENREIILQNIREFTSCVVEQEDVESLVGLFYGSLPKLSSEERLLSEAFYARVVENLKPELKLQISRKKIRTILVKNYWISCHHLVQKGQGTQARKLMRTCLKRYGFRLGSVGIYFSTFLGEVSIKKLNYIRAKYLQFL